MGWMLLGAIVHARPAHAAVGEFEVEFGPSPSPDAVGYVLHIGETSGEYVRTIDLGQPAPQSGALRARVQIDDAIERFAALSAYDADGRSSLPSNEIEIAMPVVDPVPEPEPTPDPTPPPAPDPDPAPTPAPDPDPADPAPLPDEVPMALVVTPEDAIGFQYPSGAVHMLTDASGQAVVAPGPQPATCDVDGDGDADLVLGHESGSSMTVLTLQAGIVVASTALALDAGPGSAATATRPTCAELDGDPLPELLVGLGPEAGFVIWALDDQTTGFSPLDLALAPDGEISLDFEPGLAVLDATAPRVGDLDGDGLPELVMGLTHSTGWTIVYADGLATRDRWADDPIVRSRSVLSDRAMGPAVRISALSVGDWTGDRVADMAFGFGPGSGGWVALVEAAELRRDIAEPLVVTTLEAARNSAEAPLDETRPAFVDVDGDAAPELVVGFGVQGTGDEVEILDGSSLSRRTLTVDARRFVNVGDSSLRLVPLQNAPARMPEESIDDDPDGDGVTLYCDADYDNDGAITAMDMHLLLQAWNTTPDDPRWMDVFDHDRNDAIDGLDVDRFIALYVSKDEPTAICEAFSP